MPRQTSAIGASSLFALLAVVFTICLATLPDDIYPGDPVAMRISAAALLKFGEPGLPADRVAQRDLRKLVSGSYFAENEARGPMGISV